MGYLWIIEDEQWTSYIIMFNHSHLWINRRRATNFLYVQTTRFIVKHRWLFITSRGGSKFDMYILRLIQAMSCEVMIGDFHNNCQFSSNGFNYPWRQQFMNFKRLLPREDRIFLVLVWYLFYMTGRLMFG